MKITCVLAYLYPQQRLTISRCTIAPGVQIIRLSGRIERLILSCSKQWKLHEEFGVTHAILVDEESYLAALKKRLALEGSSLPNDTSVESQAIARQAILSLVLSSRIGFTFRDAVWSFEIEDRNSRKPYVPSGWVNGPLYAMSQTMGWALLRNTGDLQFDSRKARAICSALDRYFRSGIWWVDRISMALGYFWEALCTPFSQQSFLGLTNTLESLLSTKPIEITHTLAERIAVLIGKNQADRIQTYDRFKSLYNIRLQRQRSVECAKPLNSL
jgi:hypothetical protein